LRGCADRYGGREVLERLAAELPRPHADQMQVHSGACGVCGHNLLSRQGHVSNARSFCVIGHKIAGTAEEVGELVSTFEPEQRAALTTHFLRRLPLVSCRA
jgi:D-arabinose 1-dehydrogenase-like Zn-dependent alcohol dehydrogenase